jgi:HrpA-like RNA helicase
LAERVSIEMGLKLGEEVGYSVRFEEKRSAQTRITFMTDGMAIRELMTGRMFDIFVLDEAHERSINTDVLMALLRAKMESNNNTQASNRSKHHKEKPVNFRLIIMSATI